MTRDPNTICYRGYEIDPIKECGENWLVCSTADATMFRPYPPDIDEEALDAEETLELAKAAVDADISERDK